MDAAGGHAVEVESRVVLFLLKGVENAASEFGRGVGESEKDERHQFGGKEFVVGEEME